MNVAVELETKAEVENLVYEFFAENCAVDRETLGPDTHIIEDLEGDSLMVLALLEIVRRQYGITVELQTLGRHLMAKPADTVGQIIDLTVALVKHGNGVVDVEL